MVESAVPSRASPVSNQAQWPWYPPSYYRDATLPIRYDWDNEELVLPSVLLACAHHW